MSVFFPRLGKFSVIILSKSFSAPFSILCDLCNMNLGLVDVVL